MSFDLPLPLSRYFSLTNGAPGILADDCFAADATVHDERQEHQGIPAITDWLAHARAAYQQHVTPLHWAVRDGRHRVTARVTGTFPGSPVELTHAFVLVGERITALEIG